MSYLTDSVSQEWLHVFLKLACRDQQQLQLTWKHPVFVLASLTNASLSRTGLCRRATPRVWQLISPSKPSITFWKSLRVCQITDRGSKPELCNLINEL